MKNYDTLRKEIEIINKLGLHARAAAKFVSHASRFGAHIEVKHNDKCVNGKSIMGVMMLAATKGTKLELIAQGKDARECLIELSELVEDKFGETE